MNDPKGFLKFKRQEAAFRPVAIRSQDWNEIQQTNTHQFLTEQSSRCMDCGVAFCQGPTGCPVHNLIPEWNSLVSQGHWEKAANRLLATNNFPEFTGRLCPAPCESACVLDLHSEAVNIKAIEQRIIDHAFEKNWIQPQRSGVRTGKKIAIIGSGPGGLAAAQQLVRMGHAVVVFEKENKIGGLLRYGIPDFKLEKSLIDRRLAQLKAEGVVFQTSTCFGKDITYESLVLEFDAIALAIGAERPRDISLPGRDLNGIHFAMDFLTDQNRVQGLEKANVEINAYQKKVIILGGGDTGSDCLGTAIRQGASQVLQFEIQAEPPSKRSPHTPWPFWPLKLKTSHAHQEGGERHWSLATKSFTGQAGNVTGLLAQKLKDPSLPPNETDESHQSFQADLIILALGFVGARHEYLSSIPGLKFSSQGQLETDNQLMTTVPGVFACGDVRRGASLIVWAIAEGRQMAASINKYVMKNSLSRPVTKPLAQLANSSLA